jgi:hypothetical protein
MREPSPAAVERQNTEVAVVPGPRASRRADYAYCHAAARPLHLEKSRVLGLPRPTIRRSPVVEQGAVPSDLHDMNLLRAGWVVQLCHVLNAPLVSGPPFLAQFSELD